MVLLLSLFLLFYQADDLPAAKMWAVDFSAVKQGSVKNQSCFDFDFYSRQITFRVKNRSDKTIYIYGVEGDGYNPYGYLIRLDREKNQWLDSQGSASHPPYKEYMTPVRQHFYGLEVYVLPPGRSIKFKDWAEETYLGSRFKRFIYASLSRDEEPQMITSEEFILR
ncbi:MAG TPA: hypothetical protein VJT15_14495 [Pyrinomonadaceae bacterium]|nr:hypothetical protein [Pyrinomonadaceae bacterium]